MVMVAVLPADFRRDGGAEKFHGKQAIWPPSDQRWISRVKTDMPEWLRWKTSRRR